MGLCKRKDVGNLVPAFTPNASYRLEIAPPDGILKRIDFYVRGDHTTNITTPQQDGALNIFNSMMVTFPRKGGLKPIIWNVLPRDLALMSALFEAQRNTNDNPTPTTENHFDFFTIWLALPDHLHESPDEWGLDTAELAGPIIVEGQYGPVTSIGTGSTAITTDTSVTVCTQQRRLIGDVVQTPFAAMSANQNRIQIESDARHGPTTVNLSNIDHLWGVYLRNTDDSNQAAERQDGLVTRFILEHSREGDLTDEFQIMMKKSTNKFFGLDRTDQADGIVLPVFAPTGEIGDMPFMGAGRTLRLTTDTVEQTPVEVTNVTPAAGDAVFTIPIGAQLSLAGQVEVRNALARRGPRGNRGRRVGRR